MVEPHPQIIKDTAGKEMVVLPKEEYDALMEELDDAIDTMLYDKAMQDDDGTRIPLNEAFKIIEAERNKK